MSATTLSSDRIKARKAHRCDDCGERIEPGDEYQRSAMAGDATVWTWREHPACADDAHTMLARNWFDADDWPEQFSFREMQADLHRPPSSVVVPDETSEQP